MVSLIHQGFKGNGCPTCDSDNDQRLRGKQREHDSSQNGREQNLVHTVVRVGASEHVQREGQGGEDAG